MTRVELSNVPHDAPMSKSIIEIPDDQWARMTDGNAYTNPTIQRTITTSYNGTRVIVDVHAGGSVIVWRELTPTPVCGFVQFISSGRYTCHEPVDHPGYHVPRRDDVRPMPAPIAACCRDLETSHPHA